MQTQKNFVDQQKQAKLNLLCLDDDPTNELGQQNQQQKQHWGRSLETQSYLRQKKSGRKNKRKSLKQLRQKSVLQQKSIEFRHHQRTNKQSLKELLKKLESKEMRLQKQNSQRYSTIDEFHRPSQMRKRMKQQPFQRLQSRKTTSISVKHRQHQQSFIIQSKEPNNFISKKLQLQNNYRLSKRKTQFEEKESDNQAFTSLYNSQSKRNRRFVYRKNNKENKQNEAISILQFPVQQFSTKPEVLKINWNRPQALKLSMLAPKTQNRIILNESITKKTFQILQEINNMKSINLKSSKNIYTQSIKVKKSQLGPYSQIIKHQNSVIEQYKKRRKAQFFNQDKLLNWNLEDKKRGLKLEIRK